MVSCHGYITQRSIVHSFVTVSPLRKQILSGLYGNPETLSVVGVGSTPQPRGGSTAPPLTRLYHRGRFFWKKIPKPPDVSFSMQGAVEGGWGRPITHLLVGGGVPTGLAIWPCSTTPFARRLVSCSNDIFCRRHRHPLSGSRPDRTGPAAVPSGPTHLKRSQLAGFGYTCVSIPFCPAAPSTVEATPSPEASCHCVPGMLCVGGCDGCQ